MSDRSFHDWAQGRWGEILPRIIGPKFLDGKHHPCPRGEGRDRFRYSDWKGTGGFFCACSDGRKDGFGLIQCVKNCGFKEAVGMVADVIGPMDEPKREKKKREPTWAENLQREVVRCKESKYLTNRGLITPESLRWHRALGYYEDGKKVRDYPAMCAPVINRGKFCTYHVTYLDNGGKAPVDPNRKMLPSFGSIKGGAVPLFPWKNGTLGIAEGIETAIAASMIHEIPVWAALSTSLMAAWEPPKGCESVVVMADRDKNHAGEAAAYGLAHRLIGKGIETKVRLPATIGDWADETGG